MKKITCIIMCLLVLVGFASCSSKKPAESETSPVEETTEPEQTANTESENPVTLGYYSHQSLNPFKTQSKTNKNITTLLYDSLFKVDNTYEAIGEIAESYEFEENGTLKVKILDNVYFTDASELDASDIVYSFTKAQSAPLYKNHLSNFKSAYANHNEVVFTLYEKDIYAVNCLDFPIVKYGTADNDIPTGSGRYILKKSKSKFSLVRNDSYSLSEELEQKKIQLYDINETENEIYLLQIGDLSFVYDDFSAGTPENKVGASSSQISLNNLIFLSFNSESEVLSDINIRNAVSNAIDKTTLCVSVYDSFAQVCITPFNPSWKVVSSFEKNNTGESITDSSSLLDESGYVYEYKTNKYRSKNFEFLKLELVICTADSKKTQLSKSIASELRKIGIDVTLTQYEEYDNYIKALQNGSFDMYLGEIKLSNNMSLFPFFSKSGSANYGIDTSSTVREAYYDFAAGKIDASTFIKVFDEYLPFVPICYRIGAAYYSRGIQYEGTVSEDDIFANIYSWDN